MEGRSFYEGQRGPCAIPGMDVWLDQEEVDLRGPAHQRWDEAAEADGVDRAESYRPWWELRAVSQVQWETVAEY